MTTTQTTETFLVGDPINRGWKIVTFDDTDERGTTIARIDADAHSLGAALKAAQPFLPAGMRWADDPGADLLDVYGYGPAWKAFPQAGPAALGEGGEALVQGEAYEVCGHPATFLGVFGPGHPLVFVGRAPVSVPQAVFDCTQCGRVLRPARFGA